MYDDISIQFNTDNSVTNPFNDWSRLLNRADSFYYSYSSSYASKEQLLLNFIQKSNSGYNKEVFDLYLTQDFDKFNKHLINCVVNCIKLSDQDKSFYRSLLSSFKDSSLNEIGFYTHFCKHYGIEL